MSLKTPITIMNLIFRDNQRFDIFKSQGNHKNMLRAVYNMRVHHGMLIAYKNSCADNIDQNMEQLSSMNLQLLNNKFSELSIVDSLCNSSSQLVIDTEVSLKNYLISQNMEQITNTFPVQNVVTDDDDSESESDEGEDNAEYHYLEDKSDEYFDKLTTMQRQKDKIMCGKLDINYPTIVNFFTPWCGFSKQLAPIWNELQDKGCNKNLNFLKINCDEKKDFCIKFGIKSYPSVKILMDGKIIDFPSNKPKTIESLVTFIKDNTGVNIN
jgi:thiol-disulfide isomerase/thioredoxin